METKQTKVKKGDSITIMANRWKDLISVNDKSFFSCVALINGEEVAQIDFAEGSGHQYEADITKKLIANGYVPFFEITSNSLRHYCKLNGIKYYSRHSDVNRKSNL